MGKKKPEEYRKKVHVQAIEIPCLNAKEYEDPRDAKYLQALKLTKGFDKVVKTFYEYGMERALVVQYTGSNFRATKENMPYVYGCLEEACRILNIEKVPKLYFQQSNEINACTIGVKDPILVLNKGCVRRLNHEELMFVIGHELGHIKSEHCMYHAVGSVIGQIGAAIGAVTLGLGEVASVALQVAYNDWSRKSELTADRAGFLTCQSIDASISALAKMSGLPQEYYNYFDKESFLEQAKEFQELDESKYNKVMKVIGTLGLDHPWTVMRAHELQIWLDSGEFEHILMRTNAAAMVDIAFAQEEYDKAKKAYDTANESFGQAIFNEANAADEIEKITKDIEFFKEEKARLVAERTDPRGVQQNEMALREAMRRLDAAKRAQAVAKQEFARWEKQMNIATAAYEEAKKKMEAAKEARRVREENIARMAGLTETIHDNAFLPIDPGEDIDGEED